ncbi:MAG: hypothetical protein U1F67_11380 [Rubrivivax sp.]
MAPLVLLVGAACCLPAAGNARNMTAAEAAAEIRRFGGRAFIDKHFEHESWNQVLRGIESASPQWLAVGESLKSHSDAGSSEELGLALFGALAVKPLRVLPVLQRVYKSSPERLCNQTFEAQLPKQGVAAYLNSIEQGLLLAKTAAERSMAAECKVGLESSRKYAQENGLK